MTPAVWALLALAALPAGAEAVLAEDVHSETLNATQQRVLEATLAAYAEPRHDTQLDVARIKAIVADMHGASPRRDGALKRLWRWLKRQLQAQNVEVDWLQRLLLEALRMPESVAEWVSRLAVAGMMVLMFALLVYELRRNSHGLRAPWRRGARTFPLSGAADARPAEAALTWQAAAELPPRERPGAALRLALAVLAGHGISWRDDHTHRRIASQAAGAGDAGAALAELAKMAERARYGGWPVSGAEGTRALNLGRTIADVSVP